MMKLKILFFINMLLVTIVNDCQSQGLTKNTEGDIIMDGLELNKKRVEEYLIAGFPEKEPDFTVKVKELQKLQFTKQEKTYIPKGWESYYSSFDDYYILKECRQETYDIKAILYKGNSDIVSSVFTQLFTYDKDGNIIDGLLLEALFYFEIKYTSEYSVEKNGIIKVTNYQDEISVGTKKYRLNSAGVFIKVF